MLGADAGPSKLAAIKKHNLATLDEDGFLNLIATRVPDTTDPKAAKKREKEEEAIKLAAKEIEKREKADAKEHAPYVFVYASVLASSHTLATQTRAPE